MRFSILHSGCYFHVLMRLLRKWPCSIQYCLLNYFLTLTTVLSELLVVIECVHCYAIKTEIKSKPMQWKKSRNCDVIDDK